MKPEHQQAVLRRLKNARGHLEGVIRMVEDDTYCPEVMKQLSAVQGAVQGANRLMLRNHLETCVAAAMQAKANQPSVIERVMAERALQQAEA